VLYVWHDSMPSDAAKVKDAYKLTKDVNNLSLEINSKGQVTVK
jgi:hypothetical protein